MKVVAEFDTGRDSRGAKRSIVFAEEGSSLYMLIKKSGSVTHRIEFKSSSHAELFEALFDVQEYLSARDDGDLALRSVKDRSPRQKVELIGSLAGSMSKGVVNDLSGDDSLLSSDAKSVLRSLSGSGYSSRPDIETTKETQLQMIVDEGYESDWFTSKQFRNWFDEYFDVEHGYVRLHNLEEAGLLKKREIPEEDRDDGRVKYEYKLSDKALSELEEFGGFVTDRHPRWQRKKSLIEN